MNAMKWTKIALITATLSFGFAGVSNAEETLGEKTKEMGRDIKKNTKQAWRNTKDEACELVNGKMECAGKKAKNKVLNATDEVKDKVDAD